MTYELLGLLLAGMFASGALLSYVVFYCDRESKEKEIEKLKSNLKESESNNRESKRTIESKDEQLRSLGEMIDKKKPKTQYRKIQALKSCQVKGKGPKKGEIYSGKEVIEDGLKMYSIKVNGVTYTLKRSNFKIVK